MKETTGRKDAGRKRRGEKGKEKEKESERERVYER